MALDDERLSKVDLTPFKHTLETVPPFRVEGTVTRLIGIGMEASLPDPVQGQVVEVDRGNLEPLMCEVIGFDLSKVILLPYGDLEGVRPGAPVRAVSGGLRVNAGDFLVGRIVDGIGRPIDGKGEFPRGHYMPLVRRGPNPVTRPLIDEPLVTGVRAVDAVLTLGKGQRIGIFSGSGVGKSILLGMMARHTMADINVIGLVGERGREVREFIEHDLGEEGLKRSVVVVATSNEPSLLRMRGALTATAIAEHFRDTGRDVLLMMDSLTRFALAGREVGLAAGEPPATRGYPPSVFGLIPRLLERAGRSEQGSITGLYTVLVEGDDMAEPISDIARATLDGHIVLSRDLADRGHYPAIDVLTSVSRVQRAVINPDHARLVKQIRQHLAAYKEMEDLINIGAYQRGANARVDAAIDRMEGITEFLQQEMSEGSIFEDAIERLRSAVGETKETPQPAQKAVVPPKPTRKRTGSDPLNPPRRVLPPGAYDS